MRLLLREEIIKRFVIIHNNRYDYSEFKYINSITKSKIICSIHGIFEQSASSHLQGYGCKKCSMNLLWDKLRSNKDAFICKSNIIHNYKFSYEKAIYINANTNLIITCPMHGDFDQTPATHLAGSGCYECGKLLIGIKLRSDSQKFINKANIVHNNKYDYPNVVYTINSSKIKINCRKHGEFEQIAANHLMGAGCPNCKFLKGEYNTFISIRNIIPSFENNSINRRFCVKFTNKNRCFIDFNISNFVRSSYSSVYIEYNGQQHYQLSMFSYKTTIEQKQINLKKQKSRDRKLRKYCKNNNILLIEIDGRKYRSKYDIENYLRKQFSKFNVKPI